MSLREAAVFWDYENCPSPAGWSGCKLVKRIRSLLQPFGPIKLLKAYLSISEQSQLTKNTLLRSELQASGVSLIDTPHNNRKDVADKMIMVDMLLHAWDNPPPATIVLISGDRDFAYAVSVLRLRQYDVVLITLSNAHSSLTSQASMCFDWAIDVLGTAETTPPERNKDLDSFKFPSLKFVPAAASSPTEVNINLPAMSPRKSLPRAPSSQDSKRSFDQGFNKPLAFDIHLPRPSSRTGSADSEPMSPTVDLFNSFYAKRLSQEALMLSPRGFPEPLELAASLPGPLQPPTRDLTSLLPGKIEALTPPVRSQVDPQGHGPRDSWVSSVPSASESTRSSYASVPEGPTLPSPRLKSPIFVPSDFKPLVVLLQSYHDRGHPRPFPSSVGAKLIMADKTIYDSLPNVSSFPDYALLASRAGIVEMGGDGRDAWISLKSDYLNLGLS